MKPIAGLMLLLGLSGCFNESPDELVTRLKTRDARELREVTTQLLLLDTEVIVPALRKGLHADKWRARYMSAELLGKLKAAAAVPDLVTALSDTADGVIASSAVALGEIGDSTANTALIILLAHANPDVAKRGAEALGKISSPSVVRVLWRHRLDEPPRLQAEVIKALGRCHSYAHHAALSDSILQFSRASLDDRAAQIRIAAIVSLRSFEYAGSVRQLLSLAKNPDEEIQHVAVQALGEIQSEDAPAWLGTPSPNQGLIISVLSEVMQATSNQAIRTKAIRSLGQIRASQATPLLERLVLEGTAEDRREAHQALAALRAPQ